LAEGPGSPRFPLGCALAQKASINFGYFQEGQNCVAEGNGFKNYTFLLQFSIKNFGSILLSSTTRTSEFKNKNNEIGWTK